MSYNALRIAISATWDSITLEFLRSLVDSIRERCEAVIRVNRLYTKY
jgi:hypothetical protein